MNTIKRISLITCLLCAFMLGYAQQTRYTDAVLYEAYLKEDMSVWDAYIHSVDWAKADKQERARLINYEYGYVATALEKKATDAQWHLEQFEAHVEAMTGVMPESTLNTYRSAAASYRALCGNLVSNGVKAIQFIKKAHENNAKDPLMLNLHGCIEMYSPAVLGGSKKTALSYFNQSKALIEQRGDTINNWNYLGTLMSIAQCTEKTSGKQAAINYCLQILRFEPNFGFIRDKYLPELRKK